MSNKLCIERPDFSKFNIQCGLLADPRKTWGDKWFQDHVEPINKLLREGVEVTGYGLEDMSRSWFTTQTPRMETHSELKGEHTHKALLINLTPIKQESAADVLRTILNKHEDMGNETVLALSEVQAIERLLERES